MERRKFRIDGTLVLIFLTNISYQFSLMCLFFSHREKRVVWQPGQGNEIVMRSQTNTAFSEVVLWPHLYNLLCWSYSHLYDCRHCSKCICYVHTTTTIDPRHLLIRLHKCFLLSRFVDRMKWGLYFNIL